MKTLPHITHKQHEILKLLYRHRFLNRIQIQAFLHHKDKGLSSKWLKDLRGKQYVEWIYSTDFTEKSKPAIYYLSLNGVRFLRNLNEYSAEELRKRYKEASRQRTFIDRCLLLADCCVTLDAKSTRDVGYSYTLQADYANPGSEYHFLDELKPHLYFAKHDGDITKNYLLEVFEATAPRYMIKKRLKDYIEYVDGGDWESEAAELEPPVVLLVFPTVSELIYAKRRTRKMLEDIDNEDVHIRLTTVEKIKVHDVTGMIWEEA